MRRRLSPVVILLAVGLLAAATPTGYGSSLASSPVATSGPSGPTDPQGLVAHEWGTFTSVAGDDGAAVEWVPPQGPRELPCFVDRLPSGIKGWMPATVRMETPVIYFYSPEEKTVDVRVRFKRGIISEWYPSAAVMPRSIQPHSLQSRTLEGTIAWNQVKIAPRAAEEYPVESRENHYYAARKTDASPISVGDQREKFLFYRGIGNFPLPLGARLAADGRVVVTAEGGNTLQGLFLFENANGAAGHRAIASAKGSVTIDRPKLGGSANAIRAALASALVAHGLYAKEAAAMVETWRDSWFEEGLRLFYIVPRATIDETLPLDITPAPTSIARVFVGRIELITPAMVAAVKDAVIERRAAPIVKHGRFLKPILARALATSSAAESALIQQNVSFAYTAAAPAPGGCR